MGQDVSHRRAGLSFWIFNKIHCVARSNYDRRSVVETYCEYRVPHSTLTCPVELVSESDRKTRGAFGDVGDSSYVEPPLAAIFFWPNAPLPKPWGGRDQIDPVFD
jgi:hypothetical protein